MIKKLTLATIAAMAIATPATADTLWSDPFNYDPLNGTGTYNGGDYTQLPETDIRYNPLGESTLIDNSDGSILTCDIIGQCSRW